MSRIFILAIFVMWIAPCAAQGIMVPAPGIPPSAAQSPQLSPSLAAPSPVLPDLNEDPLKGFPPLPDLGKFSPQVVSWMRLRAAGLARGGVIPEAEDMPAYIRKAGAGILGDMSSADIEALVFIVMMQAARDAHEDLKSIMEEMKKAKADKGSTDDTSEMDSLNLQSKMNRFSAILRTMSNLLKKQSDTEREIAGNVK